MHIKFLKPKNPKNLTEFISFQKIPPKQPNFEKKCKAIAFGFVNFGGLLLRGDCY